MIWVCSFKAFKKDFDDLSEKTKETFKDKYENIMQVLFGENCGQFINQRNIIGESMNIRKTTIQDLTANERLNKRKIGVYKCLY